MDQQYESSDVSGPAEQSSEHGTFNQDERYHLVAETAYFIAEQRGFQGGDPVNDWLQAEEKIESGQGEAQGAQ